MKMIALLLAGIVLTAPEDKPAIPDYFGGNGSTGQPAITQCNLTSEDLNGQFNLLLRLRQDADHRRTRGLPVRATAIGDET